MSSVLEKKFGFEDTQNGDVVYTVISYGDDYDFRKYIVVDKNLNVARRADGNHPYVIVLHEDIFPSKHAAALEVLKRIQRKIDQFLEYAKDYQELAAKLLETKE